MVKFIWNVLFIRYQTYKTNNIFVVGNAQIIVYSTYYLDHRFLFLCNRIIYGNLQIQFVNFRIKIYIMCEIKFQ